MMKKKSYSISAATMASVFGLMLALNGSALAEGMSNSSSMPTDSAANSGKLTASEQKAFSQLDTNRDGKISQTEAKKNPTLAAKFNSVDQDNNQVVDEGEFAKFEMNTQHKQ